MKALLAVLVLAVPPLAAQVTRTAAMPPVSAGAWRPLVAADDGMIMWDSAHSRPDGDDVVAWLRVELKAPMAMPDGAGGLYRVLYMQRRVRCLGGSARLLEAWFMATGGGSNVRASVPDGADEPHDSAADSLQYADLCRQVRPPVPDLVAELERGTWAWRGECHDNPHQVRLSADRRIMEIAASKPYDGADGQRDSLARYDVREITPTSIRGFMHGETRRTERGELIVWDLVLLAPGRYHWRGTTWPAGNFTDAIRRCP